MLNILLVILSAVFLHHLWTKRETLKLSWRMPGPSLWYIIRNSGQLLKGIPRGNSLFKYLQDAATTYKTPFGFLIGTTMYVVIKEPEDMKTVLNSQDCLNRPYMYDFAKSFTENGIAHLKTVQWKVHRKLLNPCLNLKSCQSFLPLFNKEIKVFISRLKNVCNTNEPIDISEYTKAMTYDSIFHTTMGREVHVQTHENFQIHQGINRTLEVISQRIFNILLHWGPIYRLTELYKAEKINISYLQDYIIKVVEEKKLKWKETYKKEQENKNETDDELLLKKPKIYIEQLMHLLMDEKKFTEDHVMGEAKTIIVGGYETVGLTCAYAILLLAIHPECQEKIHKEIKFHMPNKNSDVNQEDISKFEFLNRFIKEVLRLFPAIPLTMKEVEATLQLGKYHIPPGSNIVLPFYTLHRDKEIWGPSAEEFNPDRFLPENMENMHPYSYLPYSGGPRNCIGSKYADILLRTTVIHFVCNFKVRTDLKMTDFQIQMDMTLSLLNKHLVYIENRDD